jgi:hypothetical protein
MSCGNEIILFVHHFEDPHILIVKVRKIHSYERRSHFGLSFLYE